ncbi:zinc ccch type domain protein [Cyclospora cayetanensis]|uniref:Zinc ccch type domain protein n=1 Tax=Cyclospora cayetanensis TaxID=88456 RepID=A0A1D3D779_9EIME|nr:zinc ccch type domain protein [Cyclospora cayetanensis]
MQPLCEPAPFGAVPQDVGPRDKPIGSSLALFGGGQRRTLGSTVPPPPPYPSGHHTLISKVCLAIRQAPAVAPRSVMPLSRGVSVYCCSPQLCPGIEFRRSNKKMILVRHCNRGRFCSFAHSKEEELYHPLTYKTRLCSAFPKCLRHFCPFAHYMTELRDPFAVPLIRSVWGAQQGASAGLQVGILSAEEGPLPRGVERPSLQLPEFENKRKLPSAALGELALQQHPSTQQSFCFLGDGIDDLQTPSNSLQAPDGETTVGPPSHAHVPLDVLLQQHFKQQGDPEKESHRLLEQPVTKEHTGPLKYSNNIATDAAAAATSSLTSQLQRLALSSEHTRVQQQQCMPQQQPLQALKRAAPPPPTVRQQQMHHHQAQFSRLQPAGPHLRYGLQDIERSLLLLQQHQQMCLHQQPQHAQYGPLPPKATAEFLQSAADIPQILSSALFESAECTSRDTTPNHSPAASIRED